ncbi:hypothetical protein B224_3148 [Aeromonas media WS]|nr:hypothetical protein B224_3148 [Aeromonas media WS]
MLFLVSLRNDTLGIKVYFYNLYPFLSYLLMQEFLHHY